MKLLKLLIGTTLLLNLTAPSALGQEFYYPNSTCLSKSDQLIKNLDKYTIICVQSKVNDTIDRSYYLTRYNTDRKTSTLLLIHVLNKKFDSIGRIVSMFDNDKTSSDFVLKGRSFIQWRNNPNNLLLERYRNDITVLLNEIDKAEATTPLNTEF